MMKNRVSVGFGAFGLAIAVTCTTLGFAGAASAQMAPLVSAFDKQEARVKVAKKSYRVARKSNKAYAGVRSSKGKSASRKSKNTRVASGGGNKGSLMATLARVKPAGLPLKLAAAVVTMESGWRVNARGSSGEIGLMQLMPATARMFGGGNLYNPAENMRVGTRYLNWCYQRARGNVAVTIGCYNRGPGLMWSWSGAAITRRYVGKVNNYMRRG